MDDTLYNRIEAIIENEKERRIKSVPYSPLSAAFLKYNPLYTEVMTPSGSSVDPKRLSQYMKRLSTGHKKGRMPDAEFRKKLLNVKPFFLSSDDKTKVRFSFQEALSIYMKLLNDIPEEEREIYELSV